MKPRLGFIGVGWIGRHRMRAILESGSAIAAAVCDPSAAAIAAAIEHAPDAECFDDFERVIHLPLDGIVIATPNAMHGRQAIAALERGISVFCQKPLARTAAETREVVAAARHSNRLLGVDLSYRYSRAMQQVRDLVRQNELGSVFAADLMFHNGCGPGKPWFLDPAVSGGGCLIDLGVHLVDLALWTFDFPRVAKIRGTLFTKGQRVEHVTDVVEDCAFVELTLGTGVVVRIACSWHLHVGSDAEISATFYGPEGGAAFRNVNGSFYDFEAVRFRSTHVERLVVPPDDWGGRGAIQWVRRLASDAEFDPEIEHVIETAEVLDKVYGR